MSNQTTLVVWVHRATSRRGCLFPSLLQLEKRERLDDLRIIGYARQEWTTEQFHENLRASMFLGDTDVDRKYCDKFIDRIEFHGGDLSVEALRSLCSALDGPAIFYLALPPGVFADAAETIAKAGLADERTVGAGSSSKSRSAPTSKARSNSTRSCTRTGGKTRSSGSTTSSAKRRCRTSSCSGSRTVSSNRC